MPLPIVAAAVGGAISFLKKGGAKKVIGGAKKVVGFIGGLFKKRKRGETQNADSALPQPGPIGSGGFAGLSLVPGKTPGSQPDVADQVNDWLGRATRDTRDVKTGLNKDTMLYLGGALLALVLLLRK